MTSSVHSAYQLLNVDGYVRTEAMHACCAR